MSGVFSELKNWSSQVRSKIRIIVHFLQKNLVEGRMVTNLFLHRADSYFYKSRVGRLPYIDRKNKFRSVFWEYFRIILDFFLSKYSKHTLNIRF